ncbi:hypothetical protein SynRS9909_02144 [Synechococcus sp. RS9909]|nr:hypothetical protein SynRS9909_02144 [Synechococcus sp. RS9909]
MGLAESLLTPSIEAQVALYAPYCGGRRVERELRRALELWPSGHVNGIRPLVGAPGHHFRLQWQVVEAPLLISACTLTLQVEPPRWFRFNLAAHQLIVWLMELQSEGDGAPDLSDQFWQWLLLEASLERGLADSSLVERNEAPQAH